jgi:hypothetical protein
VTTFGKLSKASKAFNESHSNVAITFDPEGLGLGQILNQLWNAHNVYNKRVEVMTQLLKG